MKINYLLLIPLLFFAACKTDYPGQEAAATNPNAAVPVRIIEIEASKTPLPIEAGGMVSSKEEARLSFKIGGIIDAIRADEGDYVRKGQLLARLKTTEIDAQVSKATQARDKAKRDLERIERLYADSATTLENVENLRTQLEVSASDLEAVTFNQRYAQITAPFSGRITKRMAENGELTAGGQPVFLISGEGKRAYVMRIGVADRQLMRLVLGDRAEVELDAYPDAKIQARVTEIAAAANPQTGTFEVELTLENEDYPLRNGFIGRVSVFPSKTPEYVRLPMEALVDGQGRMATIYLPEGENGVTSRQIRIREFLDDGFTVSAGELAGVDRVIGAGAAYLSANSTIIQK